ncbi:MAG: acyl-CoA dehydrogenase family protein [Candidatus Latescibacterota bacterium]
MSEKNFKNLVNSTPKTLKATMSNQTHITLAKDLATQFHTRANEADQKSKLPIEDIQALKSSGYLTLNIPKKYGGFDLSLRECIEAQLELAQGSASTALVTAMQLQVFGAARDCKTWTDEIYERFCTEAVNGALFNSVATEPQLGSPSRGALFKSTAEKTDTGYCINGLKTWTTGGKHLTHMLVKAMYQDEPAVFLVEQNRPGIRWEETWKDALSFRASDSHDVYFENCNIPKENRVIPHPAPPNIRSPWFPMMLASVYLGSAIAARNTVIQYALERVPTALGKPIATLPKIRRQIGEIDMPLQAARIHLLDTADTWHGNDAKIAAAKHFAITVANDVTEKALLIAGGTALTHKLPLERHFRDVRAGHMQPPSGDTALEIIGINAINSIETKSE